MDDAPPLCVSHAGLVGQGSTRSDVFLSFARGSEADFSLNFFRPILAARKSSLDHEALPDRLHAKLAAGGVSVKGRDALRSSSQLPDPAARQSQICIPIISNDYLSNEQCLRELAQMMERKRSGLQTVLPIFDGVDPWVVRHQIWNSVKARHSDIEGLQGALEVGYLRGWIVTDWRQEELVKVVVQTVRARLWLGTPRSPQVVKYNVFLNFRGTDTREGFTKKLCTNLMNLGVSVFKDDTSIPIGEDFRSELLTAITGSTIYIAVISEEYGTSKWCRRELTKMLDCKEKMGHVVLPILYGVRPYEVRELQGNFGRAIHSRENCLRGMVAPREGHQALTGDANLRGWDHDDARERPSGMDATWEGYEVFKEVVESRIFESDKFGPEEQLIEKIADETLRKLRHHFQLDIPEHLLISDNRRTSRLLDVED